MIDFVPFGPRGHPLTSEPLHFDRQRAPSLVIYMVLECRRTKSERIRMMRLTW